MPGPLLAFMPLCTSYTGTCVAFATIAVAESAVATALRRQYYQIPELSEQVCVWLLNAPLAAESFVMPEDQCYSLPPYLGLAGLTAHVPADVPTGIAPKAFYTQSHTADDTITVWVAALQ